MFGCRACLLRGLRAIAGDAQPIGLPPYSPILLTSPRSRIGNQRFASTATLAANTDAEYGPLVPGKQPVRTAEEGDWRVARKIRDTALSPKEQKHLELELKYLSDPFKLATHVLDLLERKNQPDKALDLVRLASKDMAVIVSWNHIINWHMQRNKIVDAIKIYNEMKKRAQFPDSHTYVLLLRGLARHGHHGKEENATNVAKAIAIFNSMSGPTSRVKPDFRHINSVLQVCAAAEDMDSLWSVFSQLPQEGPGAPDQWTYTIVLNAIRISKIPQGNRKDVITHIRDQAIQEGRQVWRSLIPRWRGGAVAIDAQLVCSMGRLLLTSVRMEDLDEVFDLVQQTTNIERLVPHLGHPDRHVEHIPEDPQASEPLLESEDNEGYKELPATRVFRPILPYPADPAHPSRPTTLAWVTPTSQLLSLLMETCTALRIPKTANAYWDLLTKEYGVVPDVAAFNSLLKLVALNRNSRRAAQLIKEDMTAAGVELKNQTFRIAMRACSRDNKNPNVVANARAIIDKMEETQADLDIHTLVQYLTLALLTDNASQIIGALNRLDPIVHKLRSRMSYGTEETTMTPEADVVDREETVGLLQSMVGAIDTLMNRGLVERDQYSIWQDRRSSLDKFITHTLKRLDKLRETKNTKEAFYDARRKMMSAAKEAGRLMRQSKYNLGLPNTGMPKAEWALKVFRSKERRSDKGEENRVKAARLREWHVSHAKRDAGFADSPMELGQR